MEDAIIRRFADLAAQADRTGCYTFSDFLSEAEFAQYCTVRQQLAAPAAAFGGYENAERLMLRFGDAAQLGYETPFPIVCIHIAPLQDKFADALTHRDFLGAVMHLGISRSEIGDILVHGKQAYLFCRDTMAEYICSNIERIRHTSVRCQVTESLPAESAVHTEHMTVQCASVRIDGVIAKVYRFSRNDCNQLFRTGKVFVNGAAVTNNSLLLRAGDKVSVRGSGKFCFCGEEGTTRKGNLLLGIDRFT
ncbi:MAG: hypothetical protein IKQ91_09700 [Oscillospiraceae bacterium]|nr:hypothetical protein [Oscillospiraceae bacterium]